MPRLFLIEILLFFLPFLLYAGWLVLRQENPVTGRRWRWREVAWLSLAGLVLSVGIFGTLSRESGAHLSGRAQPETPAKTSQP